MYKQPAGRYYLFDIIEKPYYLIWWIISDNFPKLMNICEKMSSLVCSCSSLRGHDVKLKKGSFWSKCCTRCNLAVIEDPKHIIMQCPYYEERTTYLFDDIRRLGCSIIDDVMSVGDVYSILMGKHPEGVPMETMIGLWIISSKHISRMYDSVMFRNE